VRFGTGGRLRRIDLSPALELIPPLLAEWASLRFDVSGAAIDPLTGVSRADLRLIEGRHRQPGCRYAAILGTASPMATHEGRRLLVVLKHHDAWRLAASVVDEHGAVVDAEIRHGRLPHVYVNFRLDLTPLLEDDGSLGCLGRFFGRMAEGTATLDLGALEERGTVLLDAEARVSRFRAERFGVHALRHVRRRRATPCQRRLKIDPLALEPAR
jgi:hypothetical protein